MNPLCKLTTGADLTVVARQELHLNTTANKKVRQLLLKAFVTEILGDVYVYTSYTCFEHSFDFVHRWSAQLTATRLD